MCIAEVGHPQVVLLVGVANGSASDSLQCGGNNCTCYWTPEARFVGRAASWLPPISLAILPSRVSTGAFPACRFCWLCWTGLVGAGTWAGT